MKAVLLFLFLLFDVSLGCVIKDCTCTGSPCAGCSGPNCYCKGCFAKEEEEDAEDTDALVFQGTNEIDSVCVINDCTCKQFGDCSTCTGPNCVCDCQMKLRESLPSCGFCWTQFNGLCMTCGNNDGSCSISQINDKCECGNGTPCRKCQCPIS